MIAKAAEPYPVRCLNCKTIISSIAVFCRKCGDRVK